MSCRVRLGLFVLAVTWCGAASAAPVSLRYVTPTGFGCPDEAAFRTLVAARLGSDPFTADAAALVSVEIRGKGETPAVVVTLEDPRGTVRGRKQLEGGGTCDTLATSAAVTVALSVDPLLRRLEPVPEPLPPPPPPPLEPPRAEEKEPPPPPAPQPTPRVPWRGSVAAGGGVGAGATVAPQGVLRIEGRARRGVFSLSVDGRFGLPGSASLSTGRLTTTTALGTVAPCFHVGWFAGCAEVMAGAIWLSGSELAEPQRHTIFQAALGLRAQLEVPLGQQVALRGFVEGQANLVRAAAEVGPERVWTAGPVSGGGGLALVIYFDGAVTDSAAAQNRMGEGE